MRVCLVWLGDPAEVATVRAALGPWRDVTVAGDGLLLLETDETVSRVYHELKWLLPDHCALLVAPLSERPKTRGTAAGIVSWLRARLPLPED